MALPVFSCGDIVRLPRVPPMPFDPKQSQIAFERAWFAIRTSEELVLASKELLRETEELLRQSKANEKIRIAAKNEVGGE